MYGLLTASMRDGDTLRWDAASPYLLRHAAEHAAEAGVLPALLDDVEFLVHGEPRSVLNAADATELLPPIAIYRTSLPRHITASATQRRHILAVDAARHQQPELSARLHNPPGRAASPWRCLWSTAANISPALRASLTGHRQALRHLAVGTINDEPFAVTAGPDQSVRLFHVANGTLRHTWKGHTGGVTALWTDRIGPRVSLVTADAEGRLRRFAPDTGRLLVTLDVHEGPVTGLRTLAVGGRLCALSTGQDRTVRLTDLETRQIHILATAHQDDLPGLIAVGCSPKEPLALIAVGGPSAGAGHVMALDSRGRVRYEIALPAALTGLECGEADGSFVAVATTEAGTGHTWDAATGTLFGSFNRNGRPGDLDVLHVTTAVDGADQLLGVTGGSDGVIRTWDLWDQRQLHRMDGHRRAITAVTTIHDHRLDPAVPEQELGEGALDRNSLRLLTRTAADIRHGQDHMARSGLVVLSASADETVRAWHCLDGKELRQYTGHTAPVRRVAALASPAEHSRTWAVSCGDDSTGRVWDLADRSGGITGVMHPGRIGALASLSFRETSLTVTTCVDHRLRFLDTRTGRFLSTRIDGDSDVRAVALGVTRDGPVCATAGTGRGITVRLASTGAVLWRHRTDVPVIALSAGGSIRRPVLLTLDRNGRTALWELGSGRRRHGPHCDEPGVTAIATGRIRGVPVAITGRASGDIAVWNVTSGTLRRTVRTPGSAPPVVALGIADGPEGPRLVSRHAGPDHHSVRVSDADSGRLLSSRRLRADTGTSPLTVGIGGVRDASMVAVTGPDNAVRVWAAETGERRAELWLPDTVHALAFDGPLLTVAFGRELATFAPAESAPQLLAPAPDRAPRPPAPATKHGRRDTSRSVVQTTVLSLLLEWQGQNATSLTSLLCPHVPTRAVRAAVKILIKDGLIRSTSTDTLGYVLQPRGRALVAPARTPGTAVTSQPPLKLRGLHGRPCTVCAHHRIRLEPRE